VALEVGGAVDLNGLTPPVLSALRLLPQYHPCWASGHGRVLHARQAGTWGCVQASSCWDAHACLHACTHAHAHTLWAQSGPSTCSIAQSGIQGKLELRGARRRAPVHTSAHSKCCLAARSHSHTLCAPALLTAWLARGNSYLRSRAASSQALTSV